ncbi:delta(1)-pyrroline-2-carboxylate reductase [Thermus thermophilus]|uniref:ornithine cyclodeaminase n=1 Tax=Thermus thermophilus TaxID=274 RepID=UPI001C7872A0|nr:ornithine cyclodeaminase [Thermus thermophilus]BCZ91551.1 delta(1)-pyrroline-2-carboxylate reductase [Thermus thermophilus]BCZ94092.1 delta(1)-pyrroline-2-carboxylate reductase [Thermus thermophilus]
MRSYLALAEAIREVLLQGAEVPRRQVLSIPGGSFLVMPAADQEVAVCKLVTVEPQKIPAVQAEVWVKRLATGEVFHLPGEELTKRRTAALSLLAARLLAPRREGALLVVGPGALGEAHLEAFHEGFPLTRVLVRGRGRERVLAFLARARALGLPAEEWRGEEVPEDVAFIVTATPSLTPVLPEKVPEGVFLAAVGSFRPDMREVPEALVQEAALYCDTEDALREAGELQGVERPVVPLREALLGRRSEGRFVLFKSVGHALFDLAAARVVLASAPEGRQAP